MGRSGNKVTNNSKRPKGVLFGIQNTLVTNISARFSNKRILGI